MLYKYVEYLSEDLRLYINYSEEIDLISVAIWDLKKAKRDEPCCKDVWNYKNKLNYE